jgi:hypothetical protein
MAKVTITIEDGANGSVIVKCDPPVYKIQRMVKAKACSQCHGYAGFVLKQVAKMAPGKTRMPGDDQAFMPERESGKSPLLLPGRDF